VTCALNWSSVRSSTETPSTANRMGKQLGFTRLNRAGISLRLVRSRRAEEHTSRKRRQPGRPERIRFPDSRFQESAWVGVLLVLEVYIKAVGSIVGQGGMDFVIRLFSRCRSGSEPPAPSPVLPFCTKSMTENPHERLCIHFPNAFLQW